MHNTAGQRSWDLLVRGQSRFWALLCAQALPLPSDPGRTNVLHTCPPGHWLDLLARARWPVGSPMAPVVSLMPLVHVGWHQDKRVRRGHLRGQEPSLLHTHHSLMAQVRTNQSFLFMVGCFHEKSYLLRTRRAQLICMCWLIPAQDLAWSTLSNIFYQSGKKELFVLITSWHQE